MYDPECLALARYFLSDDPQPDLPQAEKDLARKIQRAIEDWFSDNRKEYQRD